MLSKDTKKWKITFIAICSRLNLNMTWTILPLSVVPCLFICLSTFWFVRVCSSYEWSVWCISFYDVACFYCLVQYGICCTSELVSTGLVRSGEVDWSLIVSRNLSSFVLNRVRRFSAGSGLSLLILLVGNRRGWLFFWRTRILLVFRSMLVHLGCGFWMFLPLLGLYFMSLSVGESR